MTVVRMMLLALLVAAPVWAVQPDEVLDDPVLEERARGLSQELRCPVCRNENIDESNADIARDLRILVRERLVAGDTDTQVLDYMVARYGEFVLLRPPVHGGNLLLWLAAPLMLLGGGIMALLFVRRSRREDVAAPSPLSAEEEARLKDVLGSKGG